MVYRYDLQNTGHAGIKYSHDIHLGAYHSFGRSSQIGENVGSFRLIRLIIIIKLYNYA